MSNGALEQTLVLIKPDALKNSLTGYVLSQLSEFHTGLCFAGVKVVHVSRMLAEEHYRDLRAKPFFSSLIDYIMGYDHYPAQPDKQRVIAIVYQGEEAVPKVRDIAGPTNPHRAREQRPGSIRSLGTVVELKPVVEGEENIRIDNLIHASATVEEAEREIKLWFKPVEIPTFMRVYETTRCTDHIYYKDGVLSAEYAPGSTCIFAGGDVAWDTDLEVLHAQLQGRPTSQTVESVVAKYLTNISAEIG